jgi:hypothetical protein
VPLQVQNIETVNNFRVSSRDVLIVNECRKNLEILMQMMGSVFTVSIYEPCETIINLNCAVI